MTLPFTEDKVSEVLDPEFVTELQGKATIYDDNQYNSDNDKWAIAVLVNDMWDEHRSQFDKKIDYLAECSRVANRGLRHKRFTESGETLRRWCELQATYAAFVDNVQDADKFLDLLSFDHLYRARKIYMAGKVKSPFEALSQALINKWTAEEMQFHYDPPTRPDEWDVMTDRVEAMQSRDFWKLKSVENVKKVLFHVGEIKKIISEDK